MSRYKNIKVNISEGQKDKIKRVAQGIMGVNIGLSGEHILVLIGARINKLAKAYRVGTGVTIKMRKSQLHHNMKVESGFLPALLPLLCYSREVSSF